MARITYAAWVSQELSGYSKLEQQTKRKEYWGDRERIFKYDQYAAYCKSRRQTPDSPPADYWEVMEQPWHKPAGIAVGALGVFAWFLGSIVTRSTGENNDR